jgi:hypothetical protein
MKSRSAIAENPSSGADRSQRPASAASASEGETFKRLAKEAQRLDDVIQKAAEMQKRIIDQIRTAASSRMVREQRPTKTPRPKPSRIRR